MDAATELQEFMDENPGVDAPWSIAFDTIRPLVATLTTERDAAEESRRFYMAERDRLREALEAQGFQAGRHGWHSLLCMGYTGQECRAECTKAREAFALGRALAGTGETP